MDFLGKSLLSERKALAIWRRVSRSNMKHSGSPDCPNIKPRVRRADRGAQDTKGWGRRAPIRGSMSLGGIRTRGVQR